MKKELYYIWLSKCFRLGSEKPRMLLEEYGEPKNVYNLSNQEKEGIEYLTRNEINSITKTTLELAEQIYINTTNLKIKICCYGDENYPQNLVDTFSPPMVLYYLGDIGCLNQGYNLTVVGTRNSTEYTACVTRYLTTSIAKAGVVIVSGCAVGIDTISHISAMQVGGKTVAILGCGLNIDYPKGSKEMKRNILRTGGALISEYCVGEKAVSTHFPIRNRLLSGVSDGVLVTQAPTRSGSLITVEHAIEQGREVFCVPPYSIFDPNHSGTIKHIRDGAIPVFSPQDILLNFYLDGKYDIDVEKFLGDYVNIKNDNSKTKITKKLVKRPVLEQLVDEKLEQDKSEVINEQVNDEKIKSLTPAQKLIYDGIKSGLVSVERIVPFSEISVPEVMEILTDLEIIGLIENVTGRKYVAK